MEKQYDIFISYRRNGGETTAVLLKSELAHLGYKVFLDFDDLPIGGDFEKKIKEVIESSHLFLFLYSYGCLNRCKSEDDTLRKEIECAIEKNIQILTLNVNLASKYYNFPPKQAKLPQPILAALGKHNFLDFFTGQYKQDSLTRLAEYMATELGKDSLGFQKKKCTLALLSEIDADLVVNGKEWTALRAHVIKHVQIDYGKYEIFFRPIDKYYKESKQQILILASRMKEIQMSLDDFEIKDGTQDENLDIAVANLTPEEIREKGWDYQFTDKPQLAIKCWMIAADMGDSAAQYSLGYQYSKGEYVPRDEEKAFEWFLKAARQGDSRAQFLLGDTYYYGSGTKRDFKQAVLWYEKAADQNNAKAIYSLACCYKLGNGVEKKDCRKAFQLYLKSATLGYHNAELVVGRCYELGEGTEKDLVQAKEWYQKAVSHGSETAKIYVERLKKKK